MPEVAVDVTITVNPENIEEIQDSFLGVIGNDNLRDELIQKGMFGTLSEN